MPYVECTGCGLPTFSAAYQFAVETCERCGADLPRPRRHGGEAGTRASLEAAVRDRLYPRGASGALDRLPR
jgi:ribosomal protein S27E